MCGGPRKEVFTDKGLEIKIGALLADNRYDWWRCSAVELGHFYKSFVLIFWPVKKEIQAQINLRYPEAALKRLEEVVDTTLTVACSDDDKLKAVRWADGFLRYWNQEEFLRDNQRQSISTQEAIKFVTILRKLKDLDLFSLMLSNTTVMRMVKDSGDTKKLLLESLIELLGSAIDLQGFLNALPSITDVLVKTSIPVAHRVPLSVELVNKAREPSSHQRDKTSKAMERGIQQLFETTIDAFIKSGGKVHSRVSVWLELFLLCKETGGMAPCMDVSCRRFMPVYIYNIYNIRLHLYISHL